jgi:hypothetical protein
MARFGSRGALRRGYPALARRPGLALESPRAGIAIPAEDQVNAHPIRLTVSDYSLQRSRLLVFFRLLLFIPHLIWLVLWTVAFLFVVIINWLVTLFAGQPAGWAHRFTTRYVRYQVHLFAFLLLAANPFPGFVGEPGSYPVDLEVDAADRQNRWKTGFRLILAVPAALINGSINGSGNLSFSISSSSSSGGGGGGGVAVTAAFLGWWVSLFTARMPQGLRNVVLYGVAYQAEVNGYLYLLTDRYPNSDPRSLPAIAEERVAHPVQVSGTGDLQRSRLTVFFRLLLAIPHLIFLYLWASAVYILVPIHWLVVLIKGESVDFFHDFFSYLLRYQVHVYSYLTLLANPFPGFLGRAGGYPIDAAVGPIARQNRWRTFFRLILGFPAFLIAGGLFGVLLTVAFLGWFASLFTARMPPGLRNLGVWAMHYQAQTYAYSLLLLTERYPYSGPASGPAPDTEPWTPPGASGP